MNLSHYSRVNPVSKRLVAVIVSGMLFACGESPTNLPDIPPLAADAFVPHIRQQILDARAAVDRKPQSARLNGELGMILHAYQLYDSAEICFRRARALDEKSFRWAYYHADVLKKMGRPSAAIAALQDSIQLDPAYPAAQARLAGLLISEGRFEESALILEHVLDQHPNFAEAIFESGRLRLRNGELKEGIALMQEFLAASGPDAAAYFAIADANRQLGHTEVAARFYALHDRHGARAPRRHDPLLDQISQFDRSTEAAVNRARRTYARGKLTETIAILEEALSRDPNNVPAHTALVAIYAEAGDFARSDEHFGKALALAPDTAELHVNLAVARMKSGRWPEAARSLENALAIDPSNALIYTQFGNLRRNMGLTGDAIEQFHLALKHDPNLPAAREGLAGALIAVGRNGDAVEALTKSSPVGNAASASTLLLLATAHENLGNFAEAMAALEAAAAIAENSEDPLGDTIRTRMRNLAGRMGLPKVPN